jgi:hypothetical protein
MADDSVTQQFAEAVGDTLASQMREQEASEAQLRAAQEEQNAQIGTARNALMDAFLNKHKQKGPQYPPEIIEIANVLLAQPRLIEPTQIFLRTVVAKINAAVNDIVAEATGQEPEPPA